MGAPQATDTPVSPTNVQPAWCVAWWHRDEKGRADTVDKIWCAAKNQSKEPKEGKNSVKTACGYWVTLPVGIEFREPTCTDCLAARSSGG
jgi:hypothetical protein